MLSVKPDQMKILIVDDSATARSMTRAAAAALGVTQITESEDGVSALDVLAGPDTQFDLILSDLNMPNLDGLALLKEVRGAVRHKETPFVLITAEGEAHLLIEAIRAGLSGSIPKPVTSEKLQKAIGSLRPKN